MRAAEADGYRAVSGHFDETAAASGGTSPHWRSLLGAIDALGAAEFRRRWAEGRRLIRENGVTYNVYGDPRGMDRPWELDPIPQLLSPGEWRGIESAVAQRAQLLNAMLTDLYGGGRLLREHLLPPELVLAHPGFLRPCRGIAVPEDVHLHVYAADLARAPDGTWWVIADRTQAPSGAGYALENRVVLSRSLPELFRPFHVQRLASYFQVYRDTLMRLAPVDDPRVVLLTPGPYNETYFEHAYLARYLGITLVEGADLTVRDDRVLLKTLSGLRRVDVILRRQDDAFCDPLELYGESALGVAGLVQAVRAGRVAVMNALGSGVVETAATMAFLPGMCRTLLDEELQMPSVATWWCGHERERRYVRENLEHLVVKPTFPGSGREVVFGGELSETERRTLVEEIDAHPHHFVAQERVALSTVPTAVEEGTAPRHLVMRVYAVAGSGGWTVMPGGLTRVSARADSLVVSSARGGGSKDTWVLSEEPVPYVTLMDRSAGSVAVSRASFALTSRVADNLLWLGRTSERIDAGVRGFRCALRRLADEPLRDAGAPKPDAEGLLLALGWLEVDDEASGADAVASLCDAAFDRERPGALGHAVASLHKLAWLLRERISGDAWRYLSRLEQDFREPESHPALRAASTLERLDRTLMLLSAFTGLVMESMTRGLGWQVLEIGRRLERGMQVAELLLHGLGEATADEATRLENVLEIADSAMTYRSRYQTSVEVPLVIDLLLFDEANPRSIGYQLMRLDQRFAALPRAPRDDIARLLARVREADLAELVRVESGEEGEPRPALRSLLTDVRAALPSFAQQLEHAYFSHAVPRRQPAGVRAVP